jgi:hypothetical protein
LQEGWGIALFLGREIRPQVDLDIARFRDEVPELLSAFTDWDVRIAKDGILTPYSRAVPLNSQTLWARPRDVEEWAIEVLIESPEGEEWVFRRDSRVRYKASEVALLSDEGVPYLRPEIQLLYKAKQPRATDDADLAAAWPLLSPSATRWLPHSIEKSVPECHWRSSNLE